MMMMMMMMDFSDVFVSLSLYLSLCLSLCLSLVINVRSPRSLRRSLPRSVHSSCWCSCASACTTELGLGLEWGKTVGLGRRRTTDNRYPGGIQAVSRRYPGGIQAGRRVSYLPTSGHQRVVSLPPVHVRTDLSRHTNRKEGFSAPAGDRSISEGVGVASTRKVWGTCARRGRRPRIIRHLNMRTLRTGSLGIRRSGNSCSACRRSPRCTRGCGRTVKSGMRTGLAKRA
jgi:hypothetical protein